MSTAVCEVMRRQQVRRTRVQTVMRVSEGERYVGDILLDGKGRVWRHADTIPADVVLKALIANRRQGEPCGELLSRADGRLYFWHVIGALAETESITDC